MKKKKKKKKKFMECGEHTFLYWFVKIIQIPAQRFGFFSLLYRKRSEVEHISTTCKCIYIYVLKKE